MKRRDVCFQEELGNIEPGGCCGGVYSTPVRGSVQPALPVVVVFTLPTVLSLVLQNSVLKQTKQNIFNRDYVPFSAITTKTLPPDFVKNSKKQTG